MADFTVNTDFAQVEADQEQVNLTRFPLFFPEKREFFLENAGLFHVGEFDPLRRTSSDDALLQPPDRPLRRRVRSPDPGRREVDGKGRTLTTSASSISSLEKPSSTKTRSYLRRTLPRLV